MNRNLISVLLGFLLVGVAFTSSQAQGTKPASKPQLKSVAQPKGAVPGVEVEIFQLAGTIPTGLPKPIKDQLPNRLAIIKQVVQADYLKNFVPSEQEGFYQRINGYLLVDASKSYVFTLRANKFAKLWLDDKEIIDLSSPGGMGDRDAEVYLEAGYHKLLVEHAGGPGGYREVTLWWNNTPSGQQEYIADKFFSHVPGSGKTAKGMPKVEVAGMQVRPGDGSPLADVHPGTAVQVLHKANIKPAVGGMDFNSKGDLYVSTWDSLGQVYLFKNVTSGDTNQITTKVIATGLAEPLGLKVVTDRLFVLQKQELTELVDNNGDEIIDEYRTICNAWGVTANFHEFAFGLEYIDGFFYAALAVGIMPGGKSANPQNKDRGKIIKIGLDGRYEVWATGLRTPNTVGIGVDRELFVCDNQGDWLPSCKLMHVQKGKFFNNYSVEPERYGKDQVTQPVAWFPQGEIGNSTSQPIALDWGPYKGQMLVGDVHYGGLQRVFVEKVNGAYQGAAIRFCQGLEGGTNRLRYGPDGALYIGMVGSNGNWGQYGKKWYGLQRMVYTAKSTFDILSMSARANGFEITFTEPLKAGFGDKAADYAIEQWKYVPTMGYGGPKVDQKSLDVTHLTVSADRRKVFIGLDGLKEGHVVYLKANYDRVQSALGGLWTTEAWYTLNAIPETAGPPAPKPKASAKAVAVTAISAVAKPKPVAKPALELNGLALIESTGCRGCHANDKMGLGPSFSAIANKYRGEKAAQARLTEKVLNGGSGVWGDQAMPTHQHVGKEKVAAMVKWVLAMP